eukprot:CAMPEP_0174879726 /NCGR_PEP_ID=MMETSP1114-20130205/83405_1 /TAXON_ID=312471 /ORGANISM="Neobodo designis, Strain CCAP 1951/1" /LENGTH=504 /DNA_ID=CAMNT_0016115121 /DNA_START=110 /DNA_END=1624 /DNA_ORIENTATION=+
MQSRVVHRRCQGITEQGSVCPLTSASGAKAAASLRNGLPYCSPHLHQGLLFFDGAGDSEEEDEELESDDELFPDLGDFPKTPCFEGGEYGLAGAVWPEKLTLPPEYTLPAWALDRSPCQDTSLARFFRSFVAFIVHAESKAVVGYIEGQLVRRADDLVGLADDHSSEMYWMVETLFDYDDIKLRPELKQNSIWGDALDHGTFVAIEQLELEPSHRGKGALRHLSAPMRAMCREWGAASAISEVAFVCPDRTVTTPRAHQDSDSEGAMRPQRVNEKLRDSYASMGFRRVGITDFMAMVVDASHPCWLASSHKPPEFPFREVAKTVRSAAFRTVVGKCVVAECTAKNDEAARYKKQFGSEGERWDFPFREVAKTVRSAAFRTVVGKCVVAECTAKNDEAARYKKQFGSEGERWDEAKVLAEANAAVDALVNHDPKTLFGNCNKEEYGMPAQLLYETLVKQMPVWRSPHNASKSLKRDIEELLRELLAMGNPLHPPRHYGMPPFDTP